MLRCKVCGKVRRSKTFILFPTGNFAREIMHKAYCGECDRYIVKLFSVKSNGDIEKREISNIKKFLDRRIILYEETSIKRRWTKAKGFKYFKGFRNKNSKKGVILRLSDDIRDSIYEGERE